MVLEINKFFVVRPLNIEMLKSLLREKFGDSFDVDTLALKSTEKFNIRKFTLINNNQTYSIACPDSLSEEEVADFFEKNLRPEPSPVAAKYKTAQAK